MHVGEITKTATAILAGRGDANEPDPREIGPILRSFGLLAERDNGGWAILLSPFGVAKCINLRTNLVCWQSGEEECDVHIAKKFCMPPNLNNKSVLEISEKLCD